MSERDDDMGRMLGLLEQIRDGVWDAVTALQEANVGQDGRQAVQDAASGAAEGSKVESSGRISDERLNELREVFGPEGHGGSRSRELFAALEAERSHALALEKAIKKANPQRAWTFTPLAPILPLHGECPNRSVVLGPAETEVVLGPVVTYRDNHHCGSDEYDDDGEIKTVRLRLLPPEQAAIMGEILSILEGFGSKEVNNTWKSGQPYITLADELIAIINERMGP